MLQDMLHAIIIGGITIDIIDDAIRDTDTTTANFIMPSPLPAPLMRNTSSSMTRIRTASTTSNYLICSIVAIDRKSRFGISGSSRKPYFS